MLPLTLPDSQWHVLYAVLQTLPGVYVRNEAKTRRFIEAVLWLARGGTSWRLLPKEYGKWNSVFQRFARWCDQGVWEALLEQASQNPDLEWLVLDSTTIRAHPCAAGASKKYGGQAAQALGRSSGGFSTKIHTVTEALGLPLRFVLTGGQTHDVTQAETLLADLDTEYVIADKGYASAELWTQIEARGAVPVIPAHPRSLTPIWYDKALYVERHVIECFFNKAKHFRRVFTRFDKLARRYLGFVYFVATLIWLR